LNISKVNQDNLVEGLEQSRLKLKILYKDMQQDPKLFEESLAHVKGGGISGQQKKVPRGNYFKNESGPPVAVSQNVRVKLPDKDDEDDDMSVVDPDAELAEEEMERMKIKHQNEMRRTKH
jgi:hypothetical protein